MKLWIDGQSLQSASRHRGIGRYVKELIRAISEGNFGFDVSISFNAAMLDEAIAARDHVQQWIHPKNIHIWQGVAEGGEADIGLTERRRLSEIAIAHHVTCLSPDIALSASPFEGADDVAVPLAPLLVPNTFTASIFYDAIPLRYPKAYLTSHIVEACYFRRLAFYKAFNLNLCISEYSRSEIIKLSGNSKSINISAGVSSDFTKLLHHESSSNATASYSKAVLYVGSLDWRKNVETLVEAFTNLPDFLKTDLKLLVVGDYEPAQLDRIERRWAERGLVAGNFIPLGRLPDRELVRLYQSVGLVVQPSLLEGFGLTALEAMSCGTPVIGSNTGALPEVLDDPDLLFDPTNSIQVADRIARTFLNHELTAKKVALSLKRAGKFSWSNTAELAATAMIDGFSSHRKNANIDRESARQQSLESLGAVVVGKDLIAGTLARAEPELATPKRLLVDTTATVRIDYGTGIQRVTKEIIRGLALKSDPSEFAAMFCDSAEGFFNVEVVNNDTGLSFKKTATKVRLLGGDTILMLDSSWELHREHRPFLLSARQRGAEIVSCLFDLVPIRLEAMCHPGVTPIFVAWLDSALSYSTAFVCISKAVADEFLAMLEAIRFPRPLKIGYWHLGADFSATLEQSIRIPTENKKRHSFLMVGTIEPRKGHRIAIEAFETLWREGFDIDLVVVGKPGWESDQLIEQLRAHPTAGLRLRWYADVKDDELQRFYHECDALIAASFVEGFGLPLVEAMHFGKAVIASDIPVFREVTDRGPSTHFFQVGSPSALTAAIKKFINEGHGNEEPPSDHSSWATWSESAAALQHVLLANGWYRTFQPSSQKPYSSIFDHGATFMTGPLSPEGRQHRLELVEGPIRFDNRLKFVLRVTNLSSQVWSSKSMKDHAWGVFLSYRTLNNDGNEVFSPAPRYAIPFVMIPDDSHYMRIEIPLSRSSDASVFLVEMFQENSCWWGSPLRIENSKDFG